MRSLQIINKRLRQLSYLALVSNCTNHVVLR
jgi:hypothetical protein